MPVSAEVLRELIVQALLKLPPAERKACQRALVEAVRDLKMANFDQRWRVHG